jgi:hypothetical protein
VGQCPKISTVPCVQDSTVTSVQKSLLQPVQCPEDSTSSKVTRGVSRGVYWRKPGNLLRSKCAEVSTVTCVHEVWLVLRNLYCRKYADVSTTAYHHCRK